MLPGLKRVQEGQQSKRATPIEPKYLFLLFLQSIDVSRPRASLLVSTARELHSSLFKCVQFGGSQSGAVTSPSFVNPCAATPPVKSPGALRASQDCFRRLRGRPKGGH